MVESKGNNNYGSASFTPGGGDHSPNYYKGREDYEYNNLKAVEGLFQEVITDKTLSYHDSMFKIIIIGDSGRLE